jgi:hypothetical protein
LKVFWSWQSDTLGKTGRHFVRDALEEAVEQLKHSPESIEEPQEREARQGLHVDQDRKGVPGSPKLADTIFEKIRAATVVVADVTPVGEVPVPENAPEDVKQKKIMNPNVAIEVGYALHAAPLREQSLLMVLNEHYGSRDDLPFDLRHNAGPITFRLAPGATAVEIKAAKAKLVGALKSALSDYLGAATTQQASTASTASPTFPEIKPKCGIGLFSDLHEVLALLGRPEDQGGNEYRFDWGAGIYLRIIPTYRGRAPIQISKLFQLLSEGLEPLEGTPTPAFKSQNQYGAMVFAPRVPGHLKSATQLFQNGEIWGYNSYLLLQGRDQKIVLPSAAIEQTFIRQLPIYLQFAHEAIELRLPYQVELGVQGIENTTIAMPDGERWGPIQRPHVSHRAIVNKIEETAVQQILLAFFEKLYELTGYPRPANLNGFPPA